jgi:site-specific DNA recombinase
MEKTKVKVAIYARYSTDQQDRTSIDGQVRNCVATATQNGYEVVARFQDEATSGTDDRRPGYRALLAAAERREFDGIVVDETSRLTRNPWELPRLIEELQFRGQFLLARGFDSRQETAHLLAGIYGGIDRLELQKIKARTHRGLRERHLGGFSAGGVAYGYSSEPVEPDNPSTRWRRTVNESEAKVVLWIFERYAEGHGAKSIAAELNRMGVPSPGASWSRLQRRADGKWQHSAILGMAARGSGILRNELYVGRVIWNRSEWIKRPGTGTRTYRLRPREQWLVEEHTELRIVSAELWDRVQIRLAAKASAMKGPGRRGKYLLTGILLCDECGRPMSMVNAHRYGCGSRNRGGNAACSNAIYLRREDAEQRFFAGVRDELLSESTLRWAELEIAKSVLQPPTQDAKRLRAELDNVAAEIERIVDAVCKVGISTALTGRLKMLEQRQRELSAEIRAAEKMVVLPDRAAIAAKWQELVDGLGDLPGRLDESEIDEARAVLRDYVGQVRVDRAGRGHAKVDICKLVAGVGFEPTTFGL